MQTFWTEEYSQKLNFQYKHKQKGIIFYISQNSRDEIFGLCRLKLFAI